MICRVQVRYGGRCTHQSPPEGSARAELALVPAAAEAKEVGAIVEVLWRKRQSSGKLQSRPKDLLRGVRRSNGGGDADARMSDLELVRETVRVGEHKKIVVQWRGVAVVLQRQKNSSNGRRTFEVGLSQPRRQVT